MNTKQAQLDEIKRSILDAEITPELSEQATQLVMGDGNPDADIVMIGEAPGKKEDEQGIPFVGASGRFLNEMLQSAGMVRADVYITNIVKYRPPNNRDPKPAEKAAFMPYLFEQLQIINPKVIITLGQHSMDCFIPGTKISQQHGQAVKVTHENAEYLVIPLYHPAAALYNGSLRQILIDDFIKAKILVEDVIA